MIGTQNPNKLNKYHLNFNLLSPNMASYQKSLSEVPRHIHTQAVGRDNTATGRYKMMSPHSWATHWFAG